MAASGMELNKEYRERHRRDAKEITERNTCIFFEDDNYCNCRLFDLPCVPYVKYDEDNNNNTLCDLATYHPRRN